MAELILSEKEKKQTWAEADEVALGKAVKYVAFQLGLADTNNTYMPAIITAAAQTLIGMAHMANADTLTSELEGVVRNNVNIGDWIVTVKKKVTSKKAKNKTTMAAKIAKELDKKFEYYHWSGAHPKALLDVFEVAKKNNCIIIYGIRDDKMMIAGAIEKEILIPNPDSNIIKDVHLNLNHGYDTKSIRHTNDKVLTVKATISMDMHVKEGSYLWSFDVDQNHERFTILNGGELIVCGKVIDLNDV